jgi:hypothetical protein
MLVASACMHECIHADASPDCPVRAFVEFLFLFSHPRGPVSETASARTWNFIFFVDTDA